MKPLVFGGIWDAPFIEDSANPLLSGSCQKQRIDFPNDGGCIRINYQVPFIVGIFLISMRCSGSIPYGYKREPDDK